jgi:class 3 adenylate cyclase
MSESSASFEIDRFEQLPSWSLPVQTQGVAGLRDRLSEYERQIRLWRETSAKLSRYVPGAIVEQITRGLEPSCGEKEISVLFVDLHGFTGFTESLRAHEVFRLLSTYTECVSKIVKKYGGTVVEFNGDGMMVIFGAPDDLPDKEYAAVAAARSIVRSLDGQWKPRNRLLPVGVGVATGMAYVGDIRSADRLIWSAVGSTTNLASRLQQLTHELESTVVIDAATWTAAGSLAHDFDAHPTTVIRGRKQATAVFALRAASAGVRDARLAEDHRDRQLHQIRGTRQRDGGASYGSGFDAMNLHVRGNERAAHRSSSQLR